VPSCISSVLLGNFTLSIDYATTTHVHAFSKSLFFSEPVHFTLYITPLVFNKRSERKKNKSAHEVSVHIPAMCLARSNIYVSLSYPFGAPSRSQSHATTDGQSISVSWCPAPSRDHAQMFATHQSYCPALVGPHLWAEVGSVLCQYRLKLDFLLNT
jgi:hypothetical protein